MTTSLRGHANLWVGTPLVLCHYTDKSCDHKHCNGGDTSLICHVTLMNICLKDYANLWVEACQGELPSCHV